MIKNATGLFIALLFIVYTSCEKAIVVYPGNNQDLTPLPPSGGISWAIPASDDDIGQLEEHTAVEITIGTLNAEDPNPDDEFSYELTNFNDYFQIVETEGVAILEVKDDINYESDQIPGSKQFDLILRVTDDSIEPQADDFTISIQITDKNEPPLWGSIPSIIADIGVLEESTISWSDTDVGEDTPVLTWNDEKPSWLDIDVNEGGMTADLTGTPTESGSPTFTMTISDGEFDVPTELDIVVRPNTAPEFVSNTGYDNFPVGSVYSFRVGCELESPYPILHFYAKDLDNDSFNNSTDNVNITVDEQIQWLAYDVIEDQPNASVKLRCNTTPTNEDASNGTQEITFTLEDDRSGYVEYRNYTLSVTVIENFEPEFLYTNNLPSSIPAGEQTTWEIEYNDQDEDALDFTFSAPNWVSFDAESRTFTANPGTNASGNSYDIEYELHEVNDGCYSTTFTHSLTIE